MWFRFYDDAYEKLREEPALGTCPFGSECQPKGWDCCSHATLRGEVGQTALPFEEQWLRERGQDMPHGCAGCSSRKTLVCTTFPVLPYPTTNGDWLVQLMLSCEGLMATKGFYVRHVQFSVFVAELLVKKYPVLIEAFRSSVEKIVAQSSGPSLVMRASSASSLLVSEDGPRLMKSLIQLQPAHGIDPRKLPVV